MDRRQIADELVNLQAEIAAIAEQVQGGALAENAGSILLQLAVRANARVDELQAVFADLSYKLREMEFHRFLAIVESQIDPVSRGFPAWTRTAPLLEIAEASRRVANAYQAELTFPPERQEQKASYERPWYESPQGDSFSFIS